MLAVVVALAPAGCGGDTSAEVTTAAGATESTAAPATTAAPAGTDTTAPAGPVKAIELKFASHIPPVGGTFDLLQKWAAKIAETTNGAVTVKLYMGGSLVQSDFAASCASGVCDIISVPFFYEPTWKLQKLVLLPEVQFPAGVPGSKALVALHQEFPVLNESYAGCHALTFTVGIPVTAVHSKVPIKLPADVKGMKIVTTSEQEKNILDAAGAVPLTMPSPDWYMSVDRNLAEAVLGPFVVTNSLGLHDLLKHHLKLSLGPAGAGVYLINQKAWDSFSPEIQQAIDDCNVWFVEQMAVKDAAETEMIYDDIVAKGGTLTDASAAEQQAWLDLTIPLTQEWVDENKNLGPTAEMLAYIEQLLQQPEYQQH